MAWLTITLFVLFPLIALLAFGLGSRLWLRLPKQNRRKFMIDAVIVAGLFFVGCFASSIPVFYFYQPTPDMLVLIAIGSSISAGAVLICLAIARLLQEWSTKKLEEMRKKRGSDDSAAD